MRLDKFLKNSRLIKRRTIAKEACDQGRIQINGQVAKAGTEVKLGDKITIEFGTKRTSVEVIDISEHVTKESSKEMYKVIE
ncbi:ribosomal 50S subunit-recycling heat shock protein [Anaerosolibacter carboniphilus]|uniref:RQC P-site tRNA stabilizing factor n=1 Tax=Anaerosolibacter carboniphilus TaxID=1417629 RepID=A0A841KXK2_9FIRM|nr:RNA-binding S4 domain-containing protein [Anaerosolibacter carboniphilus]MBB6218466.1 ribosomal 50S subunit-recycling heat shock protein [Anaerosolibacter carboniphilus]